MDVIGPIPKSSYGEEYILVIQDMLTRWVEIAPMKAADSATMLSKFMNYWVCRYGPPERLLTDRGTIFLAAVTQEYCKFFGIKKVQTTAYRPEGNGANERVHQELTKYFSMYLALDDQTHWRWLLNDAAYACNTSYHTALKASPYEVLFGQLPPLGPLGVPADVRDEDEFPKYFGVRRKELVKRRKMAYEAMNRAQDAVIASRNRHTKEVTIKVGDYVMLKTYKL
jgi:hypothetical protein